mmetsp:Transcript_38433/g.120662  ORF Transcript_38433/g.120662 Transcript_38433/m.120662 type:complete len:224 (+) Transcript_38433:1846-2517(+)
MHHPQLWPRRRRRRRRQPAVTPPLRPPPRRSPLLPPPPPPLRLQPCGRSPCGRSSCASSAASASSLVGARRPPRHPPRPPCYRRPSRPDRCVRPWCASASYGARPRLPRPRHEAPPRASASSDRPQPVRAQSETRPLHYRHPRRRRLRQILVGRGRREAARSLPARGSRRSQRSGETPPRERQIATSDGRRRMFAFWALSLQAWHSQLTVPKRLASSGASLLW